MIEVYVDKRWDLLETHVYVIDRTDKETYVYDNHGGISGVFLRGVSFKNDVSPTYIIKDYWLDEVVNALSPNEPKVDKFVFDTVNYERSIIDRLINEDKD